MNYTLRARPPLAAIKHRPPLLLLLHGMGANEDDLFALAAHCDPRFVVVSLRAPHEVAPGYYRWYQREESPSGPVFNEKEIEASRVWLVQAIHDMVVAYGADPRQVFLLGFSQGGAMALALALTAPRHLRGIVSIAGRLLRAAAALAAPPEALSHLSVLVQHGTDDEVVPIAESMAAVALLAESSVMLGFRDYKAGHTITPAMLKDAMAFLTTQLVACFGNIGEDEIV